MAILAATTLGVETAAATVHAEVRAEAGLRGLRSDAEYRLIVQTYDRDPSIPGAKPVGSIQRAVTAAEVRAGVRIDLVELRSTEASDDTSSRRTLVAWLEPGRPDLEFDARMARPPVEGLLGRVYVDRNSDRVHVTMRQESDAAGRRAVRVAV
jgi:hypothetical protein